MADVERTEGITRNQFLIGSVAAGAGFLLTEAVGPFQGLSQIGKFRTKIVPQSIHISLLEARAGNPG
ncbi:MAG: hypothetical protein ACD_79C00283G0003, partial [uncultured bacterium]